MKPTRPYLTNEPPRTVEAPAPPPKDSGSAPRPGRLRRLLERMTEGAVAVLLTLACFVLLLMAMSRTFPAATDLRDLLADRGDEAGGGRAATLAGSLAGLMDPTKVVLFVLDNEVMRREANSIVWRPAKSGVEITEGDGIQTTREGMAVVDFGRRNHLRLGRNSLIVIRRPEGDDVGPSRRATSFQVVSGELWGDFGSPTERIEVDVASGSHATHIEAGDHGPARFKVTVGENQTSAVAVYSGSAKLSIGGRTVPVAARQYVVVDSTGAMGAPLKVLDAPETLAPADGERFIYRDFPPSIVFRWRTVVGAEEYRLVVSRDPEFRKVVMDERTARPSYSVGSLAAGSYWWRATAIHNGVDGAPSTPRKLLVAEDRMPPALTVAFPEIRTARERITVEGTVEPGVRVFVSGAPAAVDAEGRFAHPVALKPGINLVIVEAVDSAGNTSYRSQQIQRVSSGGDPNP